MKESAMDAVLPGVDDVGRSRVWELPMGEETLSIDARFLGMGSSRRDRHDHPAPDLARPGQKCSACRWFEPRIFREREGRRRFLVHHTGRSVVPGEMDRTRAEWVLTPAEVIESMLTRRNVGGVQQVPYLTKPAARVLAQASEHDDDLYDAYLDRIARVG
jgi:hypothetical protein